jgi:O-antigen ligase
MNAMAFVVAQGTSVALALTLTARTLRRRYLFLGITLLCLIATFLPMSRSGVVIVVISCAAILFVSGVRFGKIILMTVVIGATLVTLVPASVWSRMTFSTQVREHEGDARAQVYTAALEYLPDYIVTGIGVDSFWGSWGKRSRFAGRHGVSGTHNVFIQVTIYWGLVGLLPLVLLVWQAYRYFPKYCGNDALALCLLGICISLLLWMMVVHNLYAKEFALGLGLLVGARRWIWPQGIVQASSQRPRAIRSPLRHTL